MHKGVLNACFYVFYECVCKKDTIVFCNTLLYLTELRFTEWRSVMNCEFMDTMLQSSIKELSMNRICCSRYFLTVMEFNNWEANIF